jgi:hypothetical protein
VQLSMAPSIRARRMRWTDPPKSTDGKTAASGLAVRNDVLIAVVAITLVLAAWLSVPTRSWSRAAFRRFAMICRRSASFHCTSSALGSFVTKESARDRPSHLAKGESLIRVPGARSCRANAVDRRTSFRERSVRRRAGVPFLHLPGAPYYETLVQCVLSQPY